MSKRRQKDKNAPQFKAGDLVHWREDLAIYTSRVVSIERNEQDEFIGYNVEPPNYWDWWTPDRRREGNYVAAEDVVRLGDAPALRAALEDWCDRLRSSRLAALTEQEITPGFSDADPEATEAYDT